ncbi:serine/threonine-protein kinase [Streptomyces sp. NPDC058254]|uniref:serine/threonine-protein kinase n=1 Tax=Streptomyces sp. NPDC058254 TaxID=3346406 RepID=UPI0036E202FC
MSADHDEPRGPDRCVGPGGRYELLKHHDSGGMGDVWQARDRNLDRVVAVKFLALARLAGVHPGGEREAELRALFDRESRTMAQISTPYVATIHDRHTEEGDPFLVMEYIDGSPLANQLGESPLPLERTVRWSRQIAEGLAAAHDKDVVHRDIKPGNILIAHDPGDVRIIDFGLARFADSTESHTGAGTPLYTSPERCRFESGDERSDLYSLGCVMYEMMTGWPPFGDRKSHPAALARAHQFRPPTRPGAHVRGVPGPLDDLVMTLLAKKPAHRPRNAHVVIRAIQEVERAPGVMEQSAPGSAQRQTPHVNTGFVERIRDTEQRIRRLTLQLGRQHDEVLKERADLAALTGRSGDAWGAAQLYEKLGNDCGAWFGRQDRRALDAFEEMVRWIEGRGAN